MVICTKNNLRFFILNRFFRLRQIVKQLDHNLSYHGHIYYLSLDELLQSRFAPKSELLERKKQLEQQKIVPLSPFITPQTHLTLDDHEENILAESVSSGQAIGYLHSITSPLEDAPFGSILILPNANPDFTHLYAKARGIIFLSGGILSHGAIIAREMNIPAVVCNKLHEILKLKGSILLDANHKLIKKIQV